MKKTFTKYLPLILALTMCLCAIPAACAADLEDADMDMTRTGSMTIYKFDLTNAEKDGVWDSSYVSTGVMDQAGVVDILTGAVRAGDSDSTSNLGNGQNSYRYENLLNVTGSGIMGYVEVPLISVNLPIFHGTDADSLERGTGCWYEAPASPMKKRKR